MVEDLRGERRHEHSGVRLATGEELVAGELWVVAEELDEHVVRGLGLVGVVPVARARIAEREAGRRRVLQEQHVGGGQVPRGGHQKHARHPSGVVARRGEAVVVEREGAVLGQQADEGRPTRPALLPQQRRGGGRLLRVLHHPVVRVDGAVRVRRLQVAAPVARGQRAVEPGQALHEMRVDGRVGGGGRQGEQPTGGQQQRGPRCARHDNAGGSAAAVLQLSAGEKLGSFAHARSCSIRLSFSGRQVACGGGYLASRYTCSARMN